MSNRNELLRKIPKIDEMLLDGRLVFLLEKYPRAVIVDELRTIIDDIRKGILADEITEMPSVEDILAMLEEKTGANNQFSLRRVINATGVVLHTNIGRACLSDKVCDHIREIAGHYSTLEYDLKKGARGSRHDHVEKIICKITGAEAAMVVNNNAAATMLCLAALAEDKEVIVSRGELVEIGGSFRIPEIMEQSGAILKEVGATNKTHVKDYRKAYNPETTGALLKVHTSNYRVFGFTQEVTLEEMVELGKEMNLPVIYDMGSGLMVDLSRYGVEEPSVLAAMKTGIDLILFSGDKLLGGPQMGILAGKKELVDKMKAHPLARAFRVDKMTLIAAEAVFREYMDLKQVQETNPVLKMITASPESMKAKAEALKEAIETAAPDFVCELEECEDSVGGGSAPTSVLKGYSLKVTSEKLTAEKIERQLRKQKMPVIVTVYHEQVHLHVRTITEEEIPMVAQSFAGIVK